MQNPKKGLITKQKEKNNSTNLADFVITYLQTKYKNNKKKNPTTNYQTGAKIPTTTKKPTAITKIQNQQRQSV